MNTPNLRAVASAHRWQVVATLLLVASGVAWVTSKDAPGVLPEAFTPPALQSLTYASIFATWLTSLVLASRLYAGAALFITCVLATIPPLNLFAWFAINARATSLLRAAGAKVGFFGARSSSLPPSLNP